MITTPDDRARKDYIGNAAAARRAGGGVRPARGRRRVRRACTRSSSRSATDGRAAARRTHRGRRAQDGAQRRRQRPALVRRRAGAARQRCSTGSPTSPRTARYFSRHREPEPPLLHDARHPGPGPGLRRRRRHQRQQGRAGDRDPVRRCAAGSSRRPRTDEEELLLDYGMHQRRLLPLLARTYALHFAQEVVAAELHDGVLRPTDGDAERARRALESRAAGTKALGTWHAHPHHPGVPRGVRRRGLPGGQPVRRAAADTDVFTTFEGDNHVLLQLVAKGLLTDYASELRGPRPARHGPVRGRAGRRDRGRADQRAQAARADHGRAARRRRRWDQEAGLLDPDYQLAMLPLARGAHARPAWPAGSSAAWTRGWTPARCSAACQDHVIARGPRPRRAAGARGVRRQDRGPARTATPGRAQPALRPATRSSTHRGRPGLVHGARPAVERRASKAISREVDDAVPPAPPDRRRPRRRLRRARGDAARTELLEFPAH